MGSYTMWVSAQFANLVPDSKVRNGDRFTSTQSRTAHSHNC